MKLQGKRILVTGATGFIGGRLAARLAGLAGVAVRGLVRSPAKGNWLAQQGVELVAGDLTQPASLAAAVAGCQLVFHAAAWVGERGSPETVWAVNVTGTQHLLKAAVNAGVERFVHLSSCAVYGSRQEFDIDEATPLRRRGELYGDSKVAAEERVWTAYRQQALPVVVARASQVYGPGSDQFTIRPIELIKAGKMILVDGGQFLCKPVYIDNLLDGLLLCAQVEAAVGEAFNLTDGVAIPWRDFFGAYGQMVGVDSFPSVPFALAWLVGGYYELAAALFGKKASFNRAVVKALRSRNSFSNQKAGRLLGWEPRIDFQEGMCRTEAWLRAEGYLPAHRL